MKNLTNIAKGISNLAIKDIRLHPIKASLVATLIACFGLASHDTIQKGTEERNIRNQFYAALDSNQDGSITEQEALRAYKQLGLEYNVLKPVPLTESQMKDYLREYRSK